MYLRYILEPNQIQFTTNKQARRFCRNSQIQISLLYIFDQALPFLFFKMLQVITIYYFGVICGFLLPPTTARQTLRVMRSLRRRMRQEDEKSKRRWSKPLSSEYERVAVRIASFEETGDWNLLRGLGSELDVLYDNPILRNTIRYQHQQYNYTFNLSNFLPISVR